MTDSVYVTHWRAGPSTVEDISSRTHIFLTNVSSAEATFALTLFGADGRPWANRSVDIEDYSRVHTSNTDANGAIGLRLSSGTTVRVELNSEDRAMGYGVIRLVEVGRSGGAILLLARGEIDSFATEEGAGYEMTTCELTITGTTPALLTL